MTSPSVVVRVVAVCFCSCFSASKVITAEISGKIMLWDADEMKLISTISTNLEILTVIASTDRKFIWIFGAQGVKGKGEGERGYQVFFPFFMKFSLEP